MKNLTYTQKVNYSFLVLVGVPIVFTIIPGFFGYVNLFTAYFPWFYLIWIVGGLIWRGWFIRKHKKDRKIEKTTILGNFLRWISILIVGFTLLVGYNSAYYGGKISGGSVSNCNIRSVYGFIRGEGMFGASNNFVNSKIPGYVSKVPLTGSLRDEFNECVFSE